MKKIILISFLVTSSILGMGCEEKVDEEKFFTLYKEILLIRKINEDTAIANPLINQLYEKKSYPAEKFKEDFLKLAKDPQSFAKKIDSIRNEINIQ